MFINKNFFDIMVKLEPYIVTFYILHLNTFLLAMALWISYLTSLYLKFLISKDAANISNCFTCCEDYTRDFMKAG